MVSAAPKQVLNQKEKAKARVVLASLVVALTFQRCAKALGLDADKLPAVTEITILLDEVIMSFSEEAKRTAFLKKVQLARIKLSKKAEKLDAGACLLESIDVLCGDKFVSHPGTRFDYIRAVLRTNKKTFAETITAPPEHRERFRKLLINSLSDI